MNAKFFTLVFFSLMLLTFGSCKEDEDSKMSHAERLVGEWVYRTTQEKIDGKWKDMPTHAGIEGAQTFYKDGKAVITMTVDGETRSQDFEWELKDNNDYFINGNVRGKLVFEGNDRFCHYADITYDPEAAGEISGEFRDIYIRKK